MSDWIEVFSIRDHIDYIKSSVDDLIKHNDLQSNTVGKSTTGRGSRQIDLTNHLNEAKDVVMLVHDVVKLNLLAKGHISAEAVLEPRTGWTVIGQENTFHGIHWHNRSRSTRHAIASVSYIQMSKNTNDKPGCLFAMINGAPITINPRLGDLIVFPVHVYHGTYPQGPGLRQTLNIDFNIK